MKSSGTIVLDELPHEITHSAALYVAEYAHANNLEHAEARDLLEMLGLA